MACVIVLDIVALAGGANECAGSAAKAGLGKLCPLIGIEDIEKSVLSEIISGNICEGELFEDLLCLSLLSVNSLAAALGKEGLYGLDELLALFGVCLNVNSVLSGPAGSVSLGSSSVDAKHAAEAVFLRLGASHCNNGSVLTAGSIVAVNRVCKENLVQNGEASCIAGTNAEYYEILALGSVVDDLDVLTLDIEVAEVLGLGEEEILGTSYGVECLAHLCALGPFLVACPAVIAVNGEIKCACGSHSRKKCVKFIYRKLEHYSLPPLLYTMLGSQSPNV